MIAAAEGLAALPATQTFKRIRSTTTIDGEPGLNVIEVASIILKGGHTLTLSGNEHTRFVINVDRAFMLKGEAAVIVEGMDPKDVVFNLKGKRGMRMAGQSTATGTFLSGNGGNVTLMGDAVLTGAALTSGNVSVLKNSELVFFDKACKAGPPAGGAAAPPTLAPADVG